MNSYEIQKKIIELSKVRNESDGEYERYSKIMFQGSNSDIQMYNTGFIDVQIFSSYQYNKHHARLWFGNIDDGSIGAWTNCDTLEEANKLVKKAKEVLLDQYNSLPDTLDELNQILREAKLYVSHE